MKSKRIFCNAFNFNKKVKKMKLCIWMSDYEIWGSLTIWNGLIGGANYWKIKTKHEKSYKFGLGATSESNALNSDVGPCPSKLN